MGETANDPLADLDEMAGTKRGPRGCVDRALEEHPDQTGLILGAVNHPRAEASVAARFLQKHGVYLGYQTISRHRRGDCRCETK